MPGKPDLLSMVWGLPEYEKILTNAVAWASNTPLPVETNAPQTVALTVMKQPEEKRTIIHLVNFTGRPYWSTPALPTSNIISEIIPVHDVHVRVKMPRKEVAKVKAVYAGMDLKFKADSGYVDFTVPLVGIHETIIITQK